MNNTFKLAAVSSAALMLAAAPAMAQDGPTLKLGGFYDQKMSVQDQDSTALVQSDVDVRQDVEIYFLGGVTLDNGLKIATRVELEGGTNDEAQISGGGNSVNAGSNNFDQIDEAFMTISGSFGSVKVGMSDTAAKSMTTGLQAMWASNVGENATFNAGKLFVTPATVDGIGIANQMDFSSDGEQISYTTPSIAGLQVSVGYAQNNFETFDGLTTAALAADGDIFDIGVRYTGKFDDMSFRIGGGYAVANDQTVGAEDDTMWMFGGNVRVGAFQLAASFSRLAETEIAGVTDVQGRDNLELGVRAFMGPSQYSIAYTHSKSSSTVQADDGDTADLVVLGMRRALGKGVSWHNTVYYADLEDGDNAPAVGAVTSNDGWAVTTGIALKF
jgi:outer membrane protein OmpU